MNISKKIKEVLRQTGFPVEQDEYSGIETKYIVFSYEDEMPVLFGDDCPIADTVYLQVQLISPKNYSYEPKKKEIRDLLESNGFIVTNIRSFLGSGYEEAEKIRQTVFSVTFTQFREEEES